MIEQWIEELETLHSDPDDNHVRADEILCEALEYLGQHDLVKAYNDVQPKWYS